MTDVLTKKQRSYCMSRIRSTGTKAELVLKKALRGKGFSYQPMVFGRPDFVSRSKKFAIFVDGCFWHKCPVCFRMPKSNLKYWNTKIQSNVERDKRITDKLKSDGWKVLRIWEHSIFRDLDSCLKSIEGGLL